MLSSMELTVGLDDSKAGRRFWRVNPHASADSNNAALG